jgi:uncharacterized protein
MRRRALLPRLAAKGAGANLGHPAVLMLPPEPDKILRGGALNWATLLEGPARSGADTVEPEFQTQFVTAGSLLYSVEHRPWLPPDAPWLLSQSWNDVLFAHFAVDPPALRRLVPDALTLEIYDGAAWLTISPFCTSHVRPSGVPALPMLSFFPQVMVRTCVSMEDKPGDDKPGLFYFSVDAANLSAVWFARVFFRMPYWHSAIQVSGATIQARNSAENTIRFRSRRLHGPAALHGPAGFDVAYSPEGEAERARRGSLDEFLTERYCAYSWNRRKLYRTEVHHQPWPLQRIGVEIRANSLADPLGLALPVKPDLCHFSRCNKLLTWAPESIRLTR